MPTLDTIPLRYPRLRQDITFLETVDGIYIRGSALNFLIRGAGAYGLLSQILPHLDGSRPIEPWLNTLPEVQRDVVERFLGVLRSKDLLHEGFAPTDSVLDALGSQRALLADLGAEPTAIERIADAHVVVLGDDAKTQRLIHCLTSNGVGARNGSVVSRSLDAPAVPEGTLIVPLFTGRDASLALRQVSSWTGHATIIPVWQTGRRLLIGPWQAPDDGEVIRSAILRASAHSTPAMGSGFAAMAFGVPHAEPELGDAVHDLLAGLLSLEIFRILGGVDGGDLRLAVTSLDVDTLQATRQPVSLHPALFPGVDTLPVATVRHPEPSDDDATEQRYRRFASVVGDPCGLFTGFDDDALPQLPIKVGRLTGAPDGGLIVGTDLRHVLGARTQALSWAAAEAALLHAQTYLPISVQKVPDDSTHELVTWLGGPVKSAEVVEVQSVTDPGDRNLVARAAVLASSKDRSPGAFAADMSGLGVGDDLDGAVVEGLRSAWAHAEAIAVEQGATTLREVRLATDRPGLSLLRCALGEEGTSARLFAPDSAAPLAILWIPGQGAWWTHGESWVDAAERVLMGRVATAQLASVPDSAAALRHIAQPLSTASLRLGGEADDVDALSSPVADLAAAVLAAGFAPFFVDLSTPDLRAVVSVARVLLRRKETGR